MNKKTAGSVFVLFIPQLTSLKNLRFTFKTTKTKNALRFFVLIC